MGRPHALGRQPRRPAELAACESPSAISRDNLHLPRETGEEELMLRLTLQRFSIAVVFFVVVVLGFTLVIPAFSQNNATIEGIVTDPSDAAVSGATIELLQLPSDKQPVQAVSSREGRFQLSGAAGRYRLTITHPSLRRYEQQLVLTAGESRELHVQLALEPLSSSVVVSTAAQPIEVNAASEPVSILTRLEIDNRQLT